MGPDLDAPSTVLRCPTCSGAVRPGAPWCTQCYADLRPTPAPVVASLLPSPLPAAAAGSSSDLTPPVASPAPSAVPAPAPAPATAVPLGATWPCATCGAANGLDVDACTSCGAGFLAGLRATEEPLLVLPVVGDLGALSRAQRLGLAAGVVLAVVLLVLVLGLLLS